MPEEIFFSPIRDLNLSENNIDKKDEVRDSDYRFSNIKI